MLSQLPRESFITLLRTSAQRGLELNQKSLAGFLEEPGQAPEGNQPQPIKIDRKLRIDYSRSQYLNQAIRVIVRIASTKDEFKDLPPQEQKELKEYQARERLLFTAYEEHPPTPLD